MLRVVQGHAVEEDRKPAAVEQVGRGTQGSAGSGHAQADWRVPRGVVLQPVIKSEIVITGPSSAAVSQVRVVVRSRSRSRGLAAHGR